MKDPRDERIMSLATIIQCIVAFSSASASGNSGRNKGKVFKPTDDWKFVRNNQETTKIVNGTTFHWFPFHYESGVWTTHESGTCDREGKHVPSKYDKKVHEAQWTKKNASSTSSNNVPSSTTNNSSNNDVEFKLDSKIQKALCTIGDGGDFDSAAFLTTYGIDDEEPKNE